MMEVRFYNKRGNKVSFKELKPKRWYGWVCLTESQTMKAFIKFSDAYMIAEGIKEGFSPDFIYPTPFATSTFKGLRDDVCVWNRKLSEEEVMELAKL